MSANLRTILEVFRHRGYQVFARPYELNIVGIRSDSLLANRFDDWVVVFFKDALGRWQLHQFRATTDPGTYYLKHPIATINSQGLKGTAILAEGQWSGYRIDLHRGQYHALCQRGAKVKVIRDYNRDSILDFGSGFQQLGFFGINIHRPSGSDERVDRDSAGCTVFARRSDFEGFMKMAWQHRRKYGNDFSYTLIDLRAMRRAKWRRFAKGAAIGLGIAGTIGVGYLALKP